MTSCKNNDTIDVMADENSSQNDFNLGRTNYSSNKVEAKRIRDYMSDTSDFIWYANQGDTSKYWTRILFQKEFLVYQFHGQCIYWFFTKHYHSKEDKIELLWSYKTDCLLPMEFLRKSNGVKHYPQPGDKFCEYRLLNDTVLIVDYNFPEWINQINKIEQDSIFPKRFYLDKSSI
jgi:hypothetical protein